MRLRRKTVPVPMAPRHHRDWRRLGRYCTCGLRWPCPDRYTAPTFYRAADAVERAPRPSPGWNAPTVANPRPGSHPALLTPAQAYRANGGRHW